MQQHYSLARGSMPARLNSAKPHFSGDGIFTIHRSTLLCLQKPVSVSQASSLVNGWLCLQRGLARLQCAFSQCHGAPSMRGCCGCASCRVRYGCAHLSLFTNYFKFLDIIKIEYSYFR